jgi:hypothetical protein
MRSLRLTFILALAASGLSAQTALQQTTLASALTSSNQGPQFVNLTAALTTCTPSISQNCLLFVEKEAMLVVSVNSTNNKLMTIIRGYDGTKAASHAALTTLWAGPEGLFTQNDYAGSCVVANVSATPLINLTTGALGFCDPSTLQFKYSGPPVMAAPYMARTTVADAAYTLTVSDYIVAYTTLTATRAVTLPTATVALAGKAWIVKDEAGAATADPITITGTLDGVTNKSIAANYGALRIYCNGTGFFTW